MRVSPTRDVFLTGFFMGIADFGSPVGALVSAGMDIFVAKYTSAGFPVWVIHTGNPASNWPLGMAIDSLGNLLVTGKFQQTINFGCGPLVSAVPTSYDIFLAKLSPAGTCLWSKSFGSSGDDYGFGVDVDAANNVLLTGAFTGRVSFGGVALYSSNSTSASSTFVAKYAPNGTYLWSRAFSQQIGNNGSDVGYAVAVDHANGDAVVVGAFQGTEYFDNLTPTTSTGLSDDFYVARFAPDGALRWVRTAGNVGSDRPYAVAIDSAGNAVLTGHFAGLLDVGGGISVNATGPLNGFVAKYGPTGTPQWLRGVTGSAVNFGQGIAVDANDAIMVTGQFQTQADFGGVILPSLGRADIFVAKYGSSGALTWAHGFGSPLDDVGYSVAVDAGGVLATGYFKSSMFVGPTQLQSAGQIDLYLMRLTP